MTTKTICFLDDGSVLILTRDARRKLVKVRFIDAAIAHYYTEA